MKMYWVEVCELSNLVKKAPWYKSSIEKFCLPPPAAIFFLLLNIEAELALLNWGEPPGGSGARGACCPLSPFAFPILRDNFNPRLFVFLSSKFSSSSLVC